MNYKLLKNATLFILGFMCYITIEVVFRGYSYAIMGCCGGLAIMILDKINDRISWDTDLMIQGLVGMVLILLMEFVIGEIMLNTDLLPVMWDYSDIPFNYHGVICLPFALAWFGLSWVAVFVADAINYYLFEELPVPYYRLFGKVVIRYPEKNCKLN